MSKGLSISLAVIGVFLLLAVSIVGWGISTYNKIVTSDEGVRSSWGQVENQYQRRYDLIPNLVETVKGYAKQEKDVLENVTAARASVGSLKVTPEVLRDPQAFAQFQKAQDGLGAALSRLLVVTENYPNLKSNENFLTLQSQLEGTENRIAVERRRFNETVQAYNVLIRRFPGSIVAGFGGFKENQYFKAAEAAEQAPQVKF
ncbi:MAG TPA: LemA family protein [Bacteroidota bacterium]|nr:LemA family protein [Bacteroidota bacterium]